MKTLKIIAALALASLIAACATPVCPVGYVLDADRGMCVPANK